MEGWDWWGIGDVRRGFRGGCGEDRVWEGDKGGYDKGWGYVLLKCVFEGEGGGMEKVECGWGGWVVKCFLRVFCWGGFCGVCCGCLFVGNF